MAFGLAAGTVRSMVGIAVRVTPTPRKTRFQLLVRLYSRGLSTRKLPMKGFKFVIYISFPSLKLTWRNRCNRRALRGRIGRLRKARSRSLTLTIEHGAALTFLQSEVSHLESIRRACFGHYDR